MSTDDTATSVPGRAAGVGAERRWARCGVICVTLNPPPPRPAARRQSAVLALRRLVRRASGDDQDFCSAFLAFTDRGFFDPPFASRGNITAILKDAGLAGLRTKVWATTPVAA